MIHVCCVWQQRKDRQADLNGGSQIFLTERLKFDLKQKRNDNLTYKFMLRSTDYVYIEMSLHIGFGTYIHNRPSKAQTSQRIRTVSQEPSHGALKC